MTDADVVVDVANAPSWEPQAVLDFFRTSARNLGKAEVAAGVRHHVALSIVGCDRMPENGYFLAKVAQEQAIEAAGVPYTIVRATQFMEFIGGIADFSTQDGTVRIGDGLFQPIAAEDVSALVAQIALAGPQNGTVEIAGGSRAVRGDRRAPPEIGRRSARGGDRPRGPLLRRPRRGNLAGAARECATRPHRPRRVAGARLIRVRTCDGSQAPADRGQSG